MGVSPLILNCLQNVSPMVESAFSFGICIFLSRIGLRQVWPNQFLDRAFVYSFPESACDKYGPISFWIEHLYIPFPNRLATSMAQSVSGSSICIFLSRID